MKKRFLLPIVVLLALFVPKIHAAGGLSAEQVVQPSAIEQEVLIVVDQSDTNFGLALMLFPGIVPPNFLAWVYYGNAGAGYNRPDQTHAGRYEVVVSTSSGMGNLVVIRFPLIQKPHVVYYTAYIKEVGRKLPNGNFEWESGRWFGISEPIGLSSPSQTIPPIITPTDTPTVTPRPQAQATATPTQAPHNPSLPNAPQNIVLEINKPRFPSYTVSAVVESGHQAIFTLELFDNAPNANQWTIVGSLPGQSDGSTKKFVTVPVFPDDGGIPLGYKYRVGVVSEQNGAWSNIAYSPEFVPAPTRIRNIVRLGAEGGIEFVWNSNPNTRVDKTELLLWGVNLNGHGTQVTAEAKYNVDLSGDDAQINSFFFARGAVPLQEGYDYFVEIVITIGGVRSHALYSPPVTYNERVQQAPLKQSLIPLWQTGMSPLEETDTEIMFRTAKGTITIPKN